LTFRDPASSVSSWRIRRLAAASSSLIYALALNLASLIPNVEASRATRVPDRASSII